MTSLLPRSQVSVREEQKPLAKYLLLRCEVTAGGVSFVGSAYLPNMAGPDLVQLAGSTSSLSSSLGSSGMTGPDDAWWIIDDCRLTLDGTEKTVPVLVRARILGNSDHRPPRACPRADGGAAGQGRRQGRPMQFQAAGREDPGASARAEAGPGHRRAHLRRPRSADARPGGRRGPAGAVDRHRDPDPDSDVGVRLHPHLRPLHRRGSAPSR
ncbi:hypothetical protein ACU686_01395 [Yinghuangia aomiensis]